MRIRAFDNRECNLYNKLSTKRPLYTHHTRKTGDRMAIKRPQSISTGIRLLDWLKTELVLSVADVHKWFNESEADRETLTDNLANLIVVSYSLAQRTAVDLKKLDARVLEKIRLGILEDHDLERQYGDLSTLDTHLRKRV